MKPDSRLVLSLLVLVAAAFVARPSAQSAGFAFTQLDLKLLAEVELLDQKLEKDGLVYRDAALADYLTGLGRSVIPPDANLERVNWRFGVLRDPLPNAFALPNGSIYVHSGLLGIIESDDQLASVLAHEVAHVLERHSYVSFRSYRKKATAIALIGFAGGLVPAGDLGWGQAVRMIAASTQMILAATIDGYSRELERQADLHAVERLVSAGFDARQMATTFRLLQETHDLELETVFYNDHPKLQDRASYVTELLGRREAAPPAADVVAQRRERFRIAVESVSRQNVQLAIDSRRYRSGVALARRLVDDNPRLSDHLYLLAESYRALGPRTPRLAPKEVTPSGRKDAQRLRQRLTAAEEDKTLLSRPEGKAIWLENQQTAEKLYVEALELDPTNYRAHRGLGLLLESVGRNEEALAAYRRYLSANAEVTDRERINRRIGALEKALDVIP
jgi:predicted Zn-dependent protease